MRLLRQGATTQSIIFRKYHSLILLCLSGLIRIVTSILLSLGIFFHRFKFGGMGHVLWKTNWVSMGINSSNCCFDMFVISGSFCWMPYYGCLQDSHN